MSEENTEREKRIEQKKAKKNSVRLRRTEDRRQKTEEMNVQHSTFNIQRRIEEILNEERIEYRMQEELNPDLSGNV